MGTRKPKYLTIAGHYRSLIKSGELPAGTQLPSRRELTKEHETSRVTIDRVVELLIAERVLESSEGNRPPRVADTSHYISTVADRVDAAKATGRALAKNETSKILSTGLTEAPDDVASLLGIDSGAEVICRSRLNLVDGEPVATGYSYYPPLVTKLAPELLLPASIPSGSRELAAERMGSEQEWLIPHVTSRLANEEERELLHLSNLAVVTQVNRQVLLADGRTVEVAVKVTSGHLPVSFRIPL